MFPPPFHPFRVSPLAVVPKHESGQFRIIHNLSFPAGSSLNDSIPKHMGSVSYARLDDAIDSILQLGTGAVLSKSDISSAFKILPVHQDDYHQLGIVWENLFYFDRTLPMGCRTSCRIFESFSTALEWIARNFLHLSHIHHILDDFIIISPLGLQSYQLKLFQDLCRRIFPLKTVFSAPPLSGSVITPVVPHHHPNPVIRTDQRVPHRHLTNLYHQHQIWYPG